MTNSRESRRRHLLRTTSNAQQELAAVRDRRERLREVFIKLATAAAAGQTADLSPCELQTLLPAVRAAIHQCELERRRR